ncbi:MAG: GTP-dependent dephospho-CoA kinase family protein [Halococcoides sp.]
MSAPDDRSDVLVSAPDRLRIDLRDPLGPIYDDADALLAEVTGPIAAVGDIVTYHLLEAGRQPTLAIVDERTERSAVDDHVRESVVPNGPDDPGSWFDRRLETANPPGTITAALIEAIEVGLGVPETDVLVRVEGEEDLATLPVVALAPSNWTIVYGQPGVGMVAAPVSAETRSIVRGLIDRMDGDPERLLDRLDDERRPE